MGVLLLLAATQLSAQFLNPVERPVPQADMPVFAQLLYQDVAKINFHAVESAYQAWKKQGFEKNAYEKYFKRWRRTVSPYVQPDGKILIPSTEAVEQQRQERLREQTQNALQFRSPSSTTWTPVALNSTHWAKNDNNAQTACPWQANIYALDVAASNPNVLFCATETGGVYKTTNKGVAWTAIGVPYFSSTQSAVAIDPSNPDVVYTGYNGGVHQSTDGGASWNNILTVNNLNVNDIKISPTNDNVLVAGSSLRRRANGIWSIPINKTVYDLAFKPTDANIVYALINNAATNLCEFWKSTDGGATFSIRSNGWIAGLTDGGGRLTITAANKDRIYAILLTGSGPRVLRSDNAGESWTMTAAGSTTALAMTNGQGYYDLSIVASPSNADHLIVASTTAYKSTDGGANFTAVGGYTGAFAIHPDIQEMTAVGGDTWIATDGGMTLSSDFFTATDNASARMTGIYGSHFWGFDSGWNEDVLVGGRYHNGNTAWRSTYAAGQFIRMGGGEAATGYVNPGNSSYTYFSDIGGRVLPNQWNDYYNFLNISKYPTESYAAMESSEQVWHPLNYNTYFLGNGTSLWKTTDNGNTFAALYTGTGEVKSIEVCRSNPNVIYFHETQSDDGKTMKSSNGGISWTACATPSGTSGSDRRMATISVSGTDENTIWIAYRNAGNGLKVFKSVDGGASWTNWTTTALNGVRLSDMFHQLGTNGGVYLMGDYGKVFYRNNVMSNWILYNAGLPMALNGEISRLKPFYKAQKLRMAANAGIWEVDFYENSTTTLVQPMADKSIVSCARDTIDLESHSVSPNPTAFQWTITPTPAYISNAHSRNPKIVLGSQGTYSVKLSVTDANGTSARTIPDMLQFNTSSCNADSIAGNALNLSGLATGGASFSPMPLKQLPFTITAWVKPTAIQKSFSQIISQANAPRQSGLAHFGLGFAFQGYTANTNLVFSAKDVSYGLTSTHNLPINIWSHVAIVVEATKVTIYVDGNPWVYNGTIAAPDFEQYPLFLNADIHGQGGDFKGLLEEIAIYNTALSQATIRETMHLTKTGLENNLMAYYQFNPNVAETGSVIIDRAKAAHGNLSGSATRVASTAPVATGTSFRMNVANGGIKDFTGTDLKLEFPAAGTYPNGEIVVSKLRSAPDQQPTVGRAFPNRYWIVRNFGTNASFSNLTSIRFENLGNYIQSSDNTALYKMFKRNSNAEGATWGTPLDTGDEWNANNNNTLSFSTNNGITTFSQFALTTDAISATENGDNSSNKYLQIQPNPNDGQFIAKIPVQTRATQLMIQNSQGRLVWQGRMGIGVSHQSIDLQGIANGLYFISALNEGGLRFATKFVICR
ncbi:MAG: hypothetical protein RLZZ628_3671 [Bacteroidota bacterium]